ncbi:hypothetical protein [Celerinatantimonas sp. MCCC 1A17872]|uniref:hypothetical protein n=1 Tax=Celerinatantimonas sp. MCCC 1A17872 TaxID=3177514 RepID=UPI0038C6D0B0
MKNCNNCEIWKIPRGFQRPSDYAATSSKLEQAVQDSTLVLWSNHNFVGANASCENWPSLCVYGKFQCPECGQTFVLSLDVDACRGSFRAISDE